MKFGFRFGVGVFGCVVFEGCFFLGGRSEGDERFVTKWSWSWGWLLFFLRVFSLLFWWKFLKIIPSYHAGSMENDPMKKVPREASDESPPVILWETWEVSDPK